MAAVTVVSRDDSVMGNRRVIDAVVNLATTGDTFATGFAKVFSAVATGGSADVTGVTVTGGSIAIASAANNGIQLHVVGL